MIECLFVLPAPQAGSIQLVWHGSGSLWEEPGDRWVK